MRTNIVALAMLAGLELSSSGAAMAEAKNLSCISGVAPNERRLIRDCGQEIFYVYEVPIQPPPPPPPPPLLVKHGESKGGGPRGQGQDHDAPAGGGNPGSSF